VDGEEERENGCSLSAVRLWSESPPCLCKKRRDKDGGTPSDCEDKGPDRAVPK